MFASLVLVGLVAGILLATGVSAVCARHGVAAQHTWAQRLHGLLSTRPPMNLAGMGIPATWAGDEFWARHIY